MTDSAIVPAAELPQPRCMVPQVRLRVLGESIIELEGASLQPSATHLFALALYLGIERGKHVSRAALTSLLFPDNDSAAAAHNLRQLLYRLRRLGAPIEATQASVRLPSEHVSGAPEAALNRTYGESVDMLIRGHALLPGYEPPTPQLSRWLEQYRDEISSKLTRRLDRDLHKARQSADWRTVEALSRAILELDSLNESATLALAEALARTGSKHRAVSLLRAFAQDVGETNGLALPSRILSRRISEELPQQTIGGREVTLVGRAGEMEQLTQTWSYSRKGHCSVVCLAGEKSIGKSRLLAELAALVKLDGTGAVLFLRSAGGDQERPMALFADLCAMLCRLPGAAGCSPSHVSYIRRLTNARDAGTQSQPTYQEEAIAAAATRSALLDLLESVAAEQALLVCIDNAEHLDEASREVLAELPNMAPRLSAMFVIATERSFPLQRAATRLVRLHALSPSDSHYLTDQLALAHAYELSREAADWCISTAAGNPGHLELLLAHAAALRDVPDIPPDFVALYDARIASLAPRARHALQACVVFGSDCCATAVAELTGLDGYELITTLEQLVEQGLVTDTEAGLACRSSLLSSRVHAAITPAVARLLHRRAAVFLESTAEGSPLQSVAWRIADHWQLGGARAQSLHWRRVCWQQLLDIGQPTAAAESIRQCLAHSKGERQRAYLLDDLAQALQCAADAAGQLAVLSDRLALCDRIGDSAARRLAIAADIQVARVNAFDDSTTLVPELQELLRSADLDEERRLRIARVLVITADMLIDADLAREAVNAVPETSLSVSSTLVAHQVRAIYHAVFGDRHLAVRYSEKLQALAMRQELSALSVTSLLTAELARRITSKTLMSLDVLRDLYTRCVNASMFDAALKVSSRIGSTLMEAGQVDDAARWRVCADAIVKQGNLKRQVADYLTLQIDLALLNGEYELARALLEEAPTRCPVYASPKWRMEYLAYHVRVHEQDVNAEQPADLIQNMLAWHMRVRRLGRHDDFMLALWTVLRNHQREHEASQLLGEYLQHHRRELGPCSYMLRMRTSQDRAWQRQQIDRNETAPSVAASFPVL
jgi:DNA-binding SARP family transcriptional activator